MKILILEDDYERVKIFKQKLIGNDVTITDSSKEAINFLQSNQYDYLFLDHDLGGKTLVASGEETGFEVAEFLRVHPKYQPHHIILHSFNPVGRKNMKMSLPESIEAPGVWLTMK